VSIGDIIIIINVIIFSFAAYLLSIEIAMYAMLTYLSASKTVDFLVDGIEEYFGVTIISENSLEIQNMIKDEMKRGFTKKRKWQKRRTCKYRFRSSLYSYHTIGIREITIRNRKN
ncbi:MAG TPA: YitT family protein, partial [Chitinophagales bacterium]|nr:YitT family protein [Chitinophagales bacterium]